MSLAFSRDFSGENVSGKGILEKGILGKDSKLELRLVGSEEAANAGEATEIDFRMALGAEFVLEGDFRSAVDEYSRVIKLRPCYADVYALRHDALTNAKRGCSEENAKALQELIVLNAQQGAVNGVYLTGAERFV